MCRYLEKFTFIILKKHRKKKRIPYIFIFCIKKKMERKVLDYTLSTKIDYTNDPFRST